MKFCIDGDAFDLDAERKKLVKQLKNMADDGCSKGEILAAYMIFSGASAKEAKEFCDENIFNEVNNGN